MTQKELAEKLGLSSKAISAWETGRNEPNMGQAYDLAGIFHIDVVDLMIGPTIEESQKEEILELINSYKQADDLTKQMVRKILGMKAPTPTITIEQFIRTNHFNESNNEVAKFPDRKHD
jgi:transcriptional regulator with XRE-family HTH domain